MAQAAQRCQCLHCLAGCAWRVRIRLAQVVQRHGQGVVRIGIQLDGVGGGSKAGALPCVLPSRPMFSPTQADVRRFLCGVHAKTQSGAPMEAIETLASLWIAEHPEYHADLSDADAAVARNYDETPGQTNPFLHLSMHLSISEQCSIDQPRGIRQAVELLTARLDSLHDAHHAAMDCLGEMLWESQRAGRPPDGEAYIACVQRRATRD